MDMNYYLHREQVERVRADRADHELVADAHRELAELYRQEIERYRTGLGAPPWTPPPA